VHLQSLITKLFSHRQWPFYLVCIITLLSQVFTAAMNILNSLIWWGRLDLDLILIGCIDSLAVTTLIAPLAIYLVRHSFNLEEMNRNLQKEFAERIMVEEALRKTEMQYQTLVDTTNTGFVIIDAEGRVLDANPEYVRLSGHRDLTDIRGRNVIEWTAGHEKEKNAEAVRQCLKAGTIRNLEIDYINAQGEVLPIEINATVVEKEGVKQILTLCRDITERKQAEKSLRESEKKYRQLAETAHDIIVTVDLNFKITYVNKAINSFTGNTNPVGRSLLDFTPPHLHQLQEIMMQKRREGFGDMLAFEWDILPPTGKIATFDIRATLLTENEKPSGVMFVCRDITERKRTEEALVESEKRYRLLAENATDVIWTTDMNLNRTYISPSIKQARGYTVKEVMSQGLSEIYTPESYAVMERILTEELAIENREQKDLNRTRTVELEYKCKDGSTIWSEVKMSFIRDSSGQAISILGAGRDITERKRMEVERLVMGKLESTGILAGGIAHDFNNLLSVILGNLDLIEGFNQSREEMGYSLKASRKAAFEARELTKQLITFSRGGDPVKKLTSLVGLLQEQVPFTLRGSPVEWKHYPAPDLRMAEVDESQIGQVIRNIVLNAREAMPEGGTVSVTATNVESTSSTNLSLPPGDYVKVSFSDQGNGIPEDILPKIFDPYFSTKQRGTKKGMGLGLTICRSIIQKHGGAITVDTNLGQGTTFHVYLRASRETIPETPALHEVLPGTGRILVMDDEEMVRNIAGALLGRLGYKVELVENGDNALERYQAAKDSGQPFDAVLLDLTVRGGMGGKEAIRELLKINPAVKAIVCSGYDQDPVMQNHADYGFKASLTKPYLISDLSEILSKVMGTKKTNETTL
jgi:PAS domain S-box-containing protein